MDLLAKRRFKAELFGHFARIGKALASAQRLELVEVLAQGEKPVEELAQALGLPLANVSQHLQVLKRAELVSARRERSHVIYRLADPAVFRLWQALRDLGEARIAEVERIVGSYLSDRDTLEAITAEELATRIVEGNVIVLDVRPESDYRSAHIAGARSIPADELEARLHELPPGATVVAYCRGPYCVYSDEAVRVLNGRGFTAKRLTVGLPDWTAMGLPVESGALNWRMGSAT